LRTWAIVSEDAVFPLEEIAHRVLSQEENSNTNPDRRIKKLVRPSKIVTSDMRATSALADIRQYRFGVMRLHPERIFYPRSSALSNVTKWDTSTADPWPPTSAAPSRTIFRFALAVYF